MSGSYRFIIFCFLFASSGLARAYAWDIFLEPFYWKATETVEWVFSNSNSTPNQNVTYKTIAFHYDPGFRVGASFENDWDMRFYYTKYRTKATDSASGNLVSTFFGGKLIQSNPFFFYQSGQINFTIDFNMFDFDLSTPICISDGLVLRPVIGLRSGWINQNIITSLQGPISIIERVRNDSKGIGPKIGIEAKWTFYCVNDLQWSFVSDFTTSYLRSRWIIKDVLYDSLSTGIRTRVGKRNFGAFALQGTLGFNVNYGCFSMKLCYEINDWFNQYQVLDDGTGAHNNNLVLQGLNLRLSYQF